MTPYSKMSLKIGEGKFTSRDINMEDTTEQIRNEVKT
jgi:hypothetical protein